MSKRRCRITQHTVLVEGEYRQLLLFADGLTDLQEELLAAADGKRTVAGIADVINKGRKKTLQNANYLVRHGYLRSASIDQVKKAAEEVLNYGDFDNGVQLYQSLYELEQSNTETALKLAELYERTAHPYEAAGIYEKLSDRNIIDNKFGDALVMARKAAALNPGNFAAQDKLAKLCVQTGRAEEAARIWRTFAMRLAGGGAFEKALEIIDSAGLQIVGSDILLYAEAEILALMGKSQNKDDNVVEFENSEDIPTEDKNSRVNISEGEGGTEKTNPDESAQIDLEKSVFLNIENVDDSDNSIQLSSEKSLKSTIEDDNGNKVKGSNVADDSIESLAELEEEVESNVVVADLPVKSGGDLSQAVLRQEHNGVKKHPVTANGMITDSDLQDEERKSEAEEIDFRALSVGEINRDNLPVRNYRQRGKGIIGFLLSGIIILLFAAAGNYYYRHKMHMAVIEVQGLNSLINESSLNEKINLTRGAYALLNASRPPFAFLFSNEFRDQLARTELMLRKSEREYENNNLDFVRFINDWRNLPDKRKAIKLATYIDNNGISLHHRLQAEEFYEKWQQESEQRTRDLKDAVEILAGEDFSHQERFAAYRKIILEFPAALEENYPTGIKDLTVPVKIRAEIAGSGKAVALQFAGVVKKTGDYIEVPVDARKKSYVLYPGYALAADEGEIGRSEIVYPLTYEQLYVLKKIPWREFSLPLKFLPIKQKVLSVIGCSILADRDYVALVDLRGGKVLDSKKLKRNPQNKRVNFELLHQELNFGVITDGRLTVGRVDIKEESYKLLLNNNIISSSVVTGELVDLELGKDSGVNILYSNEVSKSNEEPLAIYKLSNSKAGWGKKVLKLLAEKISSPIIKIIKTGWYFVLICNNGEVFVLLENGEIYKQFNLVSAENLNLKSDEINFVSSVDGSEYLLVDREIYRFDFSNDFELNELWEIKNTPLQKNLFTPVGLLQYGDGMIEMFELNNGQSIYSYSYEGRLLTEPVLYNNNIILASADKFDNDFKIIALDREIQGRKTVIWDYEFDSRIVYLGNGSYDGKDNLFVYTQDGEVYIFR